MKMPHHVMKGRKELWLGLILFVIGAYLCYDYWNGHGKNAPWPVGAVMPF
jgi:hypothetical protein